MVRRSSRSAVPLFWTTLDSSVNPEDTKRRALETCLSFRCSARRSDGPRQIFLNLGTLTCLVHGKSARNWPVDLYTDSRTVKSTSTEFLNKIEDISSFRLDVGSFAHCCFVFSFSFLFLFFCCVPASFLFFFFFSYFIICFFFCLFVFFNLFGFFCFSLFFFTFYFLFYSFSVCFRSFFCCFFPLLDTKNEEQERVKVLNANFIPQWLRKKHFLQTMFSFFPLKFCVWKKNWKKCFKEKS